MRNNYSSRGFGRSRSNRTRSSFSRFPQKNNKRNYTLSESDLVRSIEYSKNAAKQVIQDEYTPQNAFESFLISDKLKQNIYTKGYKSLTPIQDQAIPFILQERDLIGIANTGTGKTAAFLVPLIDKVSKDRTQKVLIVAPTRELAEQINSELKALSVGMGIYSALLIGGKSMYFQMKDLNRNPSFVIGTPGRLKDIISRKSLDLSKFKNVVLDETDRMVDIGFIKEIKLLISMLPKDRQSLFFSATISSKVQEILQAFVQNPVIVSVKKQETGTNIFQDVIKVTQHERKIELLHDLLNKNEFEKVIVFGSTKWGVQKLENELTGRGFKAAAIHGDKRQNQRQSILEKFKRNEIKILLATDVAARGLDISNVSHVINYDLPQTYDDYVHRIGRTGRANKSGIALTFVNS